MGGRVLGARLRVHAAVGWREGGARGGGLAACLPDAAGGAADDSAMATSTGPYVQKGQERQRCERRDVQRGCYSPCVAEGMVGGVRVIADGMGRSGGRARGRFARRGAGGMRSLTRGGWQRCGRWLWAMLAGGAAWSRPGGPFPPAGCRGLGAPWVLEALF